MTSALRRRRPTDRRDATVRRKSAHLTRKFPHHAASERVGGRTRTGDVAAAGGMEEAKGGYHQPATYGTHT